MSEWCQNKKCPEKKNQNQIRGTKGNKYYQSNKAYTYLGYWCSNGCREQWWNEHKTTCMNAVGFINKQVIPVGDAWYVTQEWEYDNEIQRSYARYFIRNKLQGIKQTITREQAQTPEQRQQDHEWYTIDDEQAKELAVTLGLSR